MQQIYEAPKTTLIYVFRICDDAHADCLKVGETTFDSGNESALAIPPNADVLNKAAHHRIKQYTQTAGIKYDLLYTEPTLFVRGNGMGLFNDKEVHQVLLRSGVRRKEFKGGSAHGTEWFVTDLATVKKAIAAVKEGRMSLAQTEVSQGQSPIAFRPEQQDAISKTVKQFKRGTQMLWNAKMRFGKTLSALQVVKQMDYARTLILTHRPVVDSGWFEDFKKIFYDSPQYAYGSKNNGETFENLEALHAKKNKHYVYFASMQDLRGSEQVGGKFLKNSDIFSTPWDLIIVDEAHEGTQTDLGKAVMDSLVVSGETRVLRLSGTPFNLLADFNEDEIYTWDYVMEQRAKQNWEEQRCGDPNPYAGLPRLNIFTYNLGKLFGKFANSDDDLAFNFREFFKTNDEGEFVHKKDVASFLNLLAHDDEDSRYPFANDAFRDIFRHTLWMVPGVRAARALSQMLQAHPVFGTFQVVNVAGDGDQDEERGDALQLVENAIGPDPDQTRTITLSCGRLTTGVSVKAWTGVLMLSGNYKTAASAYMQTIFRVQTPATINGRVKQQCYVFDFAPDRTLQVLATVPRVSTKAGKTTDGQKQALGDFLNFCPVIAIEGSKMHTLDVNHMLQQLKRAYVERVVNNGFEDNALYNDELLKLTDVQIDEFKDLKKIIGTTKPTEKIRDIDVNRQGLTNEEYEEKEKLEKKKKDELTPEEKARLDKLREAKKQKENAISILRGISIRMPLLIYGADVQDEDAELTIDNFAQLVDAQSWDEFMPQGVSKQKFATFKRYYDPDIFAAAGKRIRALARAADGLSVEERIGRIANLFQTFRNPDKETVLTPWRVVCMHMADTLGGFCFMDPDFRENLEEPRFVDQGKVTAEVFAAGSRVLEINSKSGLYPLYLAYNLYRARMGQELFGPTTVEQHQQLWDKVVAENIFVVCKTPMAQSITRRTLLGFRQGVVNTWAPDDLIDKIKNKPELFIRGVRRFVGKDMKISAVVGNPPYQEEGDNTRKAPIYHLFYDAAFCLSDKVTLITPARFLFRAGQTPDVWMDKVLADPHFRVVRYFKQSADVFPTVDIKGGVVVTMRDANSDFGPIGSFSEYHELDSILRKVKERGETGFDTIVSAKGLYKFSDKIFKEHPHVMEVQGKGSAAQITSRSLEDLPEVFLEKEPDNDKHCYIQMLGLSKMRRAMRWIKRDYIRPVESLDKYKVLVPKSNGSGAFGETLSSPIVGKPAIGHTVTFISIGCFSAEEEAEACLKYIKTKFARALLGTLKVTQDNPRDMWANIPLQTFTPGGDIDWSRSVAEIDRQLYQKYGLTDEEVAFIEKMIKPM